MRKERGHWLSRENMKQGVHELWIKCKHFPVGKDFRQNGYGGLLAAIERKHGGLALVRQQMGAKASLDRFEKRRTVWYDREKVLQKLKELIFILQHFPTANEIRVMVGVSMMNAISRHHKGLKAFRSELGYASQNHHFHNINDLLEAFRTLIGQINKFPSRKDFKALHCTYLERAAGEFGGLLKIRELLEIPETKKPSGYWKKFDNVIKVLLAVIEKLSRRPTQADIKKEGYKGMLSAIYHHHGGLTEVWIKIFKEEKPKKDYKKFEEASAAIIQIANDIGHNPSINEIGKMNPRLKYAINSYHGRIKNVRKNLELPSLYHEPGHWQDFDNIRTEIIRVQKITICFPTDTDLNKYAAKGLLAGVQLYHGGINAVRELMGEKRAEPSALEVRLKILLSRWVDDNEYVDGQRKNLRKYGIHLVNKHTGRPLQIDRFYYTAKVAIEIQGQQHYYVANKFKKRDTPGEDLKASKERDNQKREQLHEQGVILIELKFDETEGEIVAKLKPYLKVREKPLQLEEIDFSFGFQQGIERYQTRQAMIEKLNAIQSLHPSMNITSDIVRQEDEQFYKAIKIYHGGMHKARERWGKESQRNEKGSWTMTKVKEELLALYNKFGRWPVRQEITEINSKLLYGMVKFGGYEKIKEILSAEFKLK